MKQLWIRWCIRAAIVIWWLVVIYVLLIVPQLSNTITSSRELHVLAWPMGLSEEYLEPFERLTGIRVHVSYFETNEELFVKLASGTNDYDLIMVSDHSVPLLIDAQLLEQIDHTACIFWNNIYPQLKNLYFDPSNLYTIPFLWGIYGIGINTRAISKKYIEDVGWKAVFDPQYIKSSLGMLDDVREVIGLTAFYLYGAITETTDAQRLAISNVLRTQKPYVSSYTNDRADYLLLSGTAPVVVTAQYEILRASKYNPDIDFIIPYQGSFILIDSCAIPRTSKNKIEVYKLLNYLFDANVMRQYSIKFGFLPPVDTIDLKSLIPTRFAYLSPDIIPSLQFFKPIMSEKQMTTIWVDFKA